MFKMRQSLVGFLSVIALTACGQGQSQSSQVKNETVPPKMRSLPQFQVYSEHSDNAQHYHQFTSFDDMAHWYAGMQDLAAKLLGIPFGDLIPAHDPMYKQVETSVSDLWLVAKQLYPNETQGLGTPMVAIVDNDSNNAFVAYDPRLKKAALAIMVHKGIIKQMNKEELEGVLAHELAHLIFKHGWDKAKGTIEIYYSSEVSGQGFLAKDDASIRSYAKPWRKLAETVGDSVPKELIGITPRFQSTLSNILSVLHYAAAKNNIEVSGACLKSSQARFSIESGLEIFKSSSLNPTLVLTKLGVDSAVQIENQKKCFTALNKPVLQTITETLGMTKTDFASDFDELEGFDAFETVVDPTDEILKLAQVTREKMNDIASQNPMDKVRVYTTEQQADDVAVEVMYVLGRDPLALANGFLGMLNAEQRGKCVAEIAKGKEPAYGSLENSHHDKCWRAWNIRKTFDYLAGK